MFQPISTVALASAVASDGLIAAPFSRAPPPAPRRKELLAHRVIDHADLDPAAHDAGDRDAEMRDAAGEIRRAVDRVDDPHRAALARRPPRRLLADEPVLRKRAVEARGDQLLRLAVDLGQVVLRSLEPDLERGIEKPPARQRSRPRARWLRAASSRICIGSASFIGVLQKWLYDRRANVTSPPSGPTKRGSAWPSTASPTQRDRHARRRAAAASKAGAESGATEAMIS